MKSGIRMTGDIGRINYVTFKVAMGTDMRTAIAVWTRLEERERLAWRHAAETCADEEWIERGGDKTVEHHRV